jgi:hypothetical protein
MSMFMMMMVMMMCHVGGRCNGGGGFPSDVLTIKGCKRGLGGKASSKFRGTNPDWASDSEWVARDGAAAEEESRASATDGPIVLPCPGASVTSGSCNEGLLGSCWARVQLGAGIDPVLAAGCRDSSVLYARRTQR